MNEIPPPPSRPALIILPHSHSFFRSHTRPSHITGLGHGAYPFGSAGLDLLLLGLVRPLVAAGGCLFFFISIKRSSLEKCNEVGHDQFTPAGDLGSCNGNGHILSPTIHGNSHNGAGGGGGASRFSGHEGGNTQGAKGVEEDLERGCDEYVQEVLYE